MFNLLPPSIKVALKTKYRFRWFIIFLLALISLEIFSLIMLFPAWVTSVYNEKGAMAELDKAQQSDSSKSTSATVTLIKTINAKLNVLNTALEYPELTHIIDTVASSKTKSIHLTGFDFALNKSGAIIIVSGISDTRESLVSFVKTLNTQKSFKAIDLPVSNFAKDSNINFSLNISVATST